MTVSVFVTRTGWIPGFTASVEIDLTLTMRLWTAPGSE